MRARWRFWVDLLSERERGTPLALFRIALGLVVLYSLLSVAAADLVEVIWVHAQHGGMRGVAGNRVLRWLGGPRPEVVWPVYGVAVGSAIAVAAGAGGRWSALVLLQAYYALVSINGYATGGYDLMMLNGLWLLVLGSPTATLSVDCRLRTGAWVSDRHVSAWPRYLLVLQLVVVYFFTGIHKASTLWTPAGDYAALYYVLREPTWIRWGGLDAAVTDLFPLLQIGTAVTWHWEQLTPLLLLWFYCRHTRARGGWLRRWVTRFDLRVPWVLVGVGLHLAILVSLDVGPFSLIALGYYVVLWRPEEVERALRRVLRRPVNERARAAPTRPDAAC